MYSEERYLQSYGVDESTGGEVPEEAAPVYGRGWAEMSRSAGFDSLPPRALHRRGE